MGSAGVADVVFGKLIPTARESTHF
jgi:hypothetical protein